LQSLPNIRFRITDVAFAEAADALSLATGTFFVPVSRRMAVVARDAPNKRQEIEHTMAVAVPLPTTISVQEAQEMARAVQSIMEVQKFGVDANQRLAVIRDRESKVLPALALFDDLLRHRAQVSVEIELLAATETSDLSIGLRLPTEFPIVAISNSLTLGGGSAVFGLGIANSQLFASMAKGSARSLRRAEIRGIDGQAVSFHIGDRYPILTSGYYGDTGDAEGTVYRPPPTFNFEDLGIVIKVTPHIHSSSEVTLDVETEYKFLTGQSLNDIPVISNRSFKMSARLNAAETAVVSGLMSASEARSITGIAGLAQIPGLGYLFRHEIRSKESGQALLTIRPHLLALPPSEFATRTVYTGTDGRPKIPL
jgi:type II secretory pathway component GspD/PulD (secretin)